MSKKLLLATIIALLFGMLGVIGYFLPRVRKLEEFMEEQLRKKYDDEESDKNGDGLKIPSREEFQNEVYDEVLKSENGDFDDPALNQFVSEE